MTAIDNSTDPELQLKKRARRRLVGAAALALLAIIVLPMLMDQEPRPPVQDIQVQIPSQESVSPKAVLTDDPASAMPALHGGAGKAAADSAHLAKAAKDAPSAGVSADAIVSNDAANRLSPAGAAQKEMADASKPPAAQTTKPTQAAGDGPAWVVQLGAYKEEGNVKHLLAKMKELGLPTYTEKLDSGQGVRTRVRAGPFATREAAEKAQAKIKKIGVAGTVAAR